MCLNYVCLSLSMRICHYFCLGGSLRGKGWKYGSGFVDGIFPVLSPIAQQILHFVQKEVDFNNICESFDSLPPSHATWDDLINVSVQLRLNKKWDPIILVRNLCFFASYFSVKIDKNIVIVSKFQYYERT